MAHIQKVLIVDDEVLVREVTAASLSSLGLQVTKAKNGNEGLEKIREEKPDLIFLDYMMPDITGIELAEELQKDPELSQIPIVMLSGKAESTDIQKARELGIEHYLEKPTDPEEMIDFVSGEFLND